ncbi:Mevalonate kinase [Candidatus Promineifilum breve]|uniref:Mevalonate kinase n=1 Tax=Candidatus Promineifilum breve TaxID=1806508 RepID=A0A161JMH8_9CHLR|nr:mevalonate kinase [Candidatus Promineifilum breve]CUS05153.2 Mevalonate kinase [Candidatus Promineifilum breve]
MITATAPGKVILFGEHAVVYGRPALAAPVTQLRAKAELTPTSEPDVLLVAPDVGRAALLSRTEPNNPLAAVVRIVETHCRCSLSAGYTLSVTSAIPIAGGLGSGAAIAIAIIRALGQYLEQADSFTPEVVSRLAYEVERLHHGTPSGIDNTVIAYERPVYFVRRAPQPLIETFAQARPLRLIIGDTGVSSRTKDVVGDVGRQWAADRAEFETIFDACGRIAEAGRAALAAGDLPAVGALMDENHDWLRRMTVSSPPLDALVGAARAAGALGAKLSGAGRGGNMIALVTAETEAAVSAALLAAGAARVMTSDVGA